MKSNKTPRREHGIGDFPDQTNGGRGLADAARRRAAEEEMDPPTTNDCVLNMMRQKGLPITLDTYLMLAYFDGRGIEALDAEARSMLPPEVWPVPESDEIQ